MTELMDTLKITLLLASMLVLFVVAAFTCIEGIVSQLNRQLVDALVYYLIAVASMTGVLWAYTRSKYLIRAMPLIE